MREKTQLLLGETVSPSLSRGSPFPKIFTGVVSKKLAQLQSRKTDTTIHPNVDEFCPVSLKLHATCCQLKYLWEDHSDCGNYESCCLPTSVVNYPVPEGQSGQQTVDMLQKRVEDMGATKTGNFSVDCETYASVPQNGWCEKILFFLFLVPVSKQIAQNIGFAGVDFTTSKLLCPRKLH